MHLSKLHHKLFSIMAGAAIVALTAINPHAQAQTAADGAITDMRQAFVKGDRARMQALLPRVQGHLLEPLAAYWEMRSRLDQASLEEVRSFLKRYAGTYYEDRLRNDWLLLLGKRGQWEVFAQELSQYRMNDDREVRCYAMWLEHLKGNTVTDTMSELWLGQRRADDGCAQTARQLLEAKSLDRSVAWKRARVGMEMNQPAAAIQAVEMLDEDWTRIVETIHTNPERYLDEKVTALRARTKELVTLALIRLAVKDPEEAADEASKLRWRAQLTKEELSWVWGVIGKRAAQRLSDKAPDYFANADIHFLRDDHLEWRARAALRAGDWSSVSDSIAAMGESKKQEPVWVYWSARALMAQGTASAKAQGQSLLQSLAGTTGFYEQLALESTGEAVTVPPLPAPLTAAEKESVRRNPGLQRSLKAMDLGMRSEGVREWNYTVALHTPGGMTDRELLAAADLACQHEIWDRCINTSKRTKEAIDYRQRFPLPYRDTVVKRAQEVDLDPAYVYGLMRQESRFVTDARSHVGASGLMQVMPATAKWTAKKIGLKGFQPHHITELQTNVKIGTAYLKLGLDDFEGSMAMAAAGYNAGPNRPRAWRNGPVLEAAVWIENIPFEETRDYVKRVLSNTNNYAAILTGKPQWPSSRLAPIGPRPKTSAAPDSDLP